MKDEKKLRFNLNDSTKWTEIFWIRFEIETSIDALKKMIEMQNNVYWELDEKLYRKIKSTRRLNGFMTEEEAEQYVSHMHGIEESVVAELGKIQVANQIAAIFSIFENKLKVICDKLAQDFEFEKPEKKAPYIPNYWKTLQSFLKEKSNSIEKFYTPIYNKYVVRNVLHHQNSVAEEAQFKMFKHIESIMVTEFENQYYIWQIDGQFCKILITEIELFFSKLIQTIKEKTDE